MSTIISVDSSALYPQYSPNSTKLLCLRVGVDARLSCVRAQDLAFLLKIVPWELEQFASTKLHLITLWNTSSMEQNTTQQVTLLTDKPRRWIIILNCSQLKLVKSIKINLLKKNHTYRDPKHLLLLLLLFSQDKWMPNYRAQQAPPHPATRTWDMHLIHILPIPLSPPPIPNSSSLVNHTSPDNKMTLFSNNCPRNFPRLGNFCKMSFGFPIWKTTVR